ncbi:hypothetical protein DAPPUDRAFT_312964 [Daphnia pulex]|uniref:Uncharacterized protein n=2 Tax=Daphnia pulex TaxID=6669 RepID=E9G148_DAPPU|nr:hypothetical protein DAPPUDRAFT_312964 [Daphnia pulex]|eukprot:EFX86605.1 hypothetical protein DAPPUDRAFT_312964 [Daphnia pulex]
MSGKKHRQRPLVEALHKKINMANCRQYSCYPSSDFSVLGLLVLPSSVRFHLYVLFPARQPSAIVRGSLWLRVPI